MSQLFCFVTTQFTTHLVYILTTIITSCSDHKTKGQEELHTHPKALSFYLLSFMAVKASLEKQLTCAVCLDLYTNPKTLPCHHSFCLQCIERLHLDPQGDGTYFIACPTCRHRTQLPPDPAGPAGFPTAFHLNNLMETYTLMNKASDPQQVTCPNHQKPLEIFCETCEEVICLHCTRRNHKDHEWNLFIDSYHKHCQELERSLAPIKEKVTAVENFLTTITTRENEIGEQSEAVKQEIHVMEEEMIRAIRESARQLTRKVETVTDDKLKVLSEQKKSAEMSLGYLKDCEEYVEQCLQTYSQQQVLMSKKQMMEHISQVTKQISMEEFNPIEKADLQFIKNSKAVKRVHRMGGIVFTLQQQCKVKAQVECPSTSPQSPKCPPVTVPASPSPFNPYHKNIITVHTIGELQSPWGVAVGNDGSHVIVTEHWGHRVTVLDREGKKVKSFGGEGGSGDVKFYNPYGVAITPDNFILVTDNDRIQKVTMDGECIASAGKYGSGRLQFNYPHGIVISPITGHIYIADYDNHRIQVLTPDLTFSHSFGKEGSAKGEFQYPRDIAINSKGLLYVTDRDNNRIQVFTPEGQFVARFGTKGRRPGHLYNPLGITIDRSTDLVYVTEEYNHRISVFTSEGQFVDSYGKYGILENQFNTPTGIILDSQGVLYVCDTGNNRLVTLVIVYIA